MNTATHSPGAQATAPILVVGLGNPILGDDGVGWRVAEAVLTRLASGAPALPPAAVEVDCLSLGGLSLMERLIGYRQVILIDSITTHRHPPGALLCFPLESLPDLSGGHTMSSAHDSSLQTALEMGRRLGAALPERVEVVAIEAEFVYDFSEELSPPIQAAAAAAEQAVIDIISQMIEERNDFS